jgi:hypothetical protein
VINAGVPGYSPRQIRQRLEELLPQAEPDLVVFGFVTETFVRMTRPLIFFGGTLVRSDAVANMRLTETGILYSPYSRAWLREADFWLNQHWQLGAHAVARLYAVTHRPEQSTWQRIGLDPENVRQHMQSSFDELSVSARLAREKGADFVVLLINLQDRGASFGPRQAIYNQVTMQYCARERISCIDPLPELDRAARGQPIFRTPSDQHWSPAAHAIAADALLDFIRTRSAE